MKIDTLHSRDFGTNTYIISSSGFSILIDPAVSFCDLSECYQKSLKMVFLTHGHYDHFSQIASFKGKGLTFYMHKNAYEKMLDPFKNFSYALEYDYKEDLKGEKIVFVTEGEVITTPIGDVSVVELFGHTDCSVGYLINNDLFSGDVIFSEGIGRCDLYSGDIKVMKETLERIKSFPDYNVYPGHGEITTVKEFFLNNYYLY